MPAYVMAYAYTDWLQFTGPVQTALRALHRLAGARILVPGDPLARRRRGDAVVRALSVRLPRSRAPRSSISRAARSRRDGSPGYGALGRVHARRAADRAAGDRRRRRRWR